MLDQRPDFRLLAIVSPLGSAQSSGPISFLVDLVLDSKGVKSLFVLGAFVGTVGVQARPSVRFSHQFLKRHAVMHIGARHPIVGDQIGARIGFDMILVAEEIHAVFLYPACIGVLVCSLGIIPLGRNLTTLDSFIFLPLVALMRNLHNRGVDNRSGFGKHSLGLQLGGEVLEDLTLQSFFCQGIPESPKACVVGDRLTDMKPKKAGEGKSVGALILQLLVAEIEEAFNNQGLEHQNHIQRLATGRTFPLRLAQSLSQNGTKHLEINSLAQRFQWVVQTTQSGKALAFNDKGTWYVFTKRVTAISGLFTCCKTCCYFSNRPNAIHEGNILYFLPYGHLVW
jgi:hypothetical protein